MHIERLDLSRPVMAQFEVTDACNHRCLHCYHLDSETSNRPASIISDAILMKIAQKIVEAGIFNVVITGGEPLLRKGITQTIIRYFKSCDIQVSINTNLTVIDKDTITFLKEYDIPVLTSCPSGVSAKYDYMVGANNSDLFYKNLRTVLDDGVRCSVNMVVTKDNLEDIRETAIAVKSMGCKSFSATPMFFNMDYPRMDLVLTRNEVQKVISELLWTHDNLGLNVDILESLPKCIFPNEILNKDYIFLNRKCQAGRTVVGISPSGEVRPCSTNSQSYGNILKEDIRSIWSNMKDWRSTQFFPLTCLDCSWLDRCNAGCRINSKVKFGEWNSPEIWQGEVTPNIEPISDYVDNNLHPDDILYINKSYKVREEYDGIYTIYIIKDESFLMVNQTLMAFIEDLSQFNTTTLNKLAEAYNTDCSDNDFISIINLLINKNIIGYEKVI